MRLYHASNNIYDPNSKCQYEGVVILGMRMPYASLDKNALLLSGSLNKMLFLSAQIEFAKAYNSTMGGAYARMKRAGWAQYFAIKTLQVSRLAGDSILYLRSIIFIKFSNMIALINFHEKNLRKRKEKFGKVPLDHITPYDELHHVKLRQNVSKGIMKSKTRDIRYWSRERSQSVFSNELDFVDLSKFDADKKILEEIERIGKTRVHTLEELKGQFDILKVIIKSGWKSEQILIGMIEHALYRIGCMGEKERE